MAHCRQKAIIILNRLLSFLNLQVHRIGAGFWEYDTDSMMLYESVKNKTLVRIDRCYMLYQFAKSASLALEGDVAQVGVYKGGTAKIIVTCFRHTQQKVYLFDTFEGLPPVSAHDGDKTVTDKHFKFEDVILSDLKNDFAQFPHVEFRQGLFPSTAVGLEHKKFSFVYLDADLYESTRDGLNFFYPRMVPGGVILLDDYKSDTWPGVIKAVDEFCAQQGISAITTTWWQGLIVKGTS